MIVSYVSGCSHAIWGGSWYSPLRDARVAYRTSVIPDYRDYDFGVRLVRRVL
jgi:formylglycine-generating enzyme required for sulfatase activity